MIVLGIESSCDETALALVRDGRHCITSKVASSVEKQAVFGGVVPEVAAREHLTSLVPLFEELIAESNFRNKDIDAIAVTRGPGLIGSLLVGISFAKSLSLMLDKPLIPVDHVHAHLHGALLGLEADANNIFPAIGLVVSGGHTNIYFMKNEVEFEKLAGTIDDACGECFDKVGKTLGLPYPGGPQIEKIAKEGDPAKYSMPVMVQEKKRLEFSYSGLKTHVLNTFRKVQRDTTDPAQIELEKAHIASAFQEEAFGHIVRKLRSSLLIRPDAKSVLIAGGVAANLRFRQLLTSSIGKRILFPELTYCSDNGAMIAALGYYLYESEDNKSCFHNSQWEPYSRHDFKSD